MTFYENIIIELRYPLSEENVKGVFLVDLVSGLFGRFGLFGHLVRKLPSRDFLAIGENSRLLAPTK
jgi:hypothetical protein